MKNINIPQKVKPIIKKTGFKINHIIDRSSRFFTAIGFLKGKKHKYFFKVCLNKDPNNLPNFKNEIKASLALQKGIRFKLTPRIIHYSLKKPLYLIREYSEGKIFGDTHTLVPEYHNPNWKKDYKKVFLTDFRIYRIIYLLKRLRKINDFSGIFTHKLQDWHAEIKPNLEILKNSIDPQKLIKLEDEIEKSYNNPIFKKYLCHGDFNLSNFITSNEIIYVIDWEYAHKGNIGYDFMYFWFALWQRPDWQNSVLKKYLKSLSQDEIEEFNASLSFNLSINIIKQYSHWFHSKADYLQGKQKKVGTYYRFETIGSAFLFYEEMLEKFLTKKYFKAEDLIR